MAAPFTTYKLIVLYMISHSEREISNSQITDFILERGYTSYFHLQQAISELVEAKLLEKRTVFKHFLLLSYRRRKICSLLPGSRALLYALSQSSASKSPGQ